MTPDPNTLERLIPEEVVSGDATGGITLKLHLDRYRFAAKNLRPNRVLDIACGVGYGTRLMADCTGDGGRLTGVDLSQAAIEYANQNYKHERTNYVTCDGMEFEDDQGFDTIVSLETIEHLPDPSAFIGHLVGLLRPGGRLIASVPTTPGVDVNPHHLHDFTSLSFEKLLARHGLEIVGKFPQHQSFGIDILWNRSEVRMSEMRENLPAYYMSHPRAFVKRIAATLRYGLCAKYLTVICRQRSGPTDVPVLQFSKMD